MKTLIILLLSNFLFSGNDWTSNLDNAKAKAQTENKLILLNFSGSDWCGPCIKLKKEVFEAETFQKIALEKLVLVNADFPRLKKNQLEKTLVLNNESIAEKYNQEGKFPYTVLLNSKGEVIKSWEATNKITFLNELVSLLPK